MLRNQRGMTLLEIIVVVTILAVLMSIIGVQVTKSGKKARYEEAKIHLAQLSKALELYSLECGSYPPSDIGLDALKKDPGTGCRSWGGPYFKGTIKDPWGNPIVYQNENGNFFLMSYGEDGREGGTDLAKDITSDDTEE